MILTLAAVASLLVLMVMVPAIVTTVTIWMVTDSDRRST